MQPLSLPLEHHLDETTLLARACDSAAVYRGGREQWKRLRAAARHHLEVARQLDAGRSFVAALVETFAPSGSLWRVSAAGPSYQLIEWKHELHAAHPRPRAIMQASDGRRVPVDARELLNPAKRWWRVS